MVGNAKSNRKPLETPCCQMAQYHKNLTSTRETTESDELIIMLIEW